MSETPDLASVNPVMFGTFYPEGFVVAVVDDPARAEAAVAALRDAGSSTEDVMLRPGAHVLANYRAHRERRGLLERLAPLFPSEESDVEREYLEEAEQDRTFVAVRAPERDRRDRVAEILRAHGGRAIRYYGPRTITDLG